MELTEKVINEHCEAVGELCDDWGAQSVAIIRALQNRLREVERERDELTKAIRWVSTITANYDFIDLKEICDYRSCMLSTQPEEQAHIALLLKVLEEPKP